MQSISLYVKDTKTTTMKCHRNNKTGQANANADSLCILDAYSFYRLVQKKYDWTHGNKNFDPCKEHAK